MSIATSVTNKWTILDQQRREVAWVTVEHDGLHVTQSVYPRAMGVAEATDLATAIKAAVGLMLENKGVEDGDVQY
jgi:hypothetical protein